MHYYLSLNRRTYSCPRGDKETSRWSTLDQAAMSNKEVITKPLCNEHITRFILILSFTLH